MASFKLAKVKSFHVIEFESLWTRSLPKEIRGEGVVRQGLPDVLDTPEVRSAGKGIGTASRQDVPDTLRGILLKVR